MSRRTRTRSLTFALFALTGLVGTVPPGASAAPNPVALTEADYQVYGRVFSDPQGCENNPPATPPEGVSPFAKGNACFAQYLSYDEVVQGAQFLQQRFSTGTPARPRFLRVIQLDEAYNNPNFRSAGLPQEFGFDENGDPQVLDRDDKPLYMFKVTDADSPIPESERAHFAYVLSIHGIERAGVEGGIRAMEDLVTWAACEVPAFVATTPACNAALPTHFEGPFPKSIVETSPAGPDNPTVGDVLRRSVIYFLTPNPDGWERGEVAEGDPGFQRYNGNGMDLNRDWPTIGYTYRPYSPGSEPETKAYAEVLRGIKNTLSAGKFTGGIDLHGQLTAYAFSYTLLGSGQRDYRKNFSTVDQSLRTWRDQTSRLAWAPPHYISDANNNGVNDSGETCVTEPVFGGRLPMCVADQWGTVIDTLGYQITGGSGDWIDSPIGLGAVGIDNEMSLSHLAPNTGYDPINEQMHVDGNKGLIYSQIASMLSEQDSDFVYDPSGKIGYVFNPKRISHPGSSSPQNPGYPAQNDMNAILPCAETTCEGGEFYNEGSAYNLEFNVSGPDQGIFNGGITVRATFLNANGISIGSASRLELQRFDDEGPWVTVASAFVQGGSPDLYLQGGQIVTANDPVPSRWRVRLTNAGTAAVRVEVDFSPHAVEEGSGQRAFSASSMDFFDHLNNYIADPAEHVQPVSVARVINAPATLRQFDTLVVANDPLPAYTNPAGDPLALTEAEREKYYESLSAFAGGGGNLVLTDRALEALPEIGVLPEGSVSSGQPSGRGAAPRYQFNVPGRGNTCPTWDPANPPASHPDPLTEAVCLPGTAGGTLRQVVEPVPLGYAPDANLDGATEAKVTFYYVDRATWETECGKDPAVACTTATLTGTALGERHFQDGVVRIAGSMFPDPNFVPDGPRDMRFGLSSYALAFSAWQIFLNLVDYQRPSGPAADVDLSIVKTDSSDPVNVGQRLTYDLKVTNQGPQTATNVTVVDTLPQKVEFVSAGTGCQHTAGVVTCILGDLSNGAQKSVQIVVRPTTPGTLVNKASVDSPDTDTDSSDDSDTEETRVLPLCPGHEQIEGSHLVGTEGKDVLKATEGPDVVCGMGGDDKISGLGGDDVLIGNAGDDVIRGGAGNDRITAGHGSDKVLGGGGNDVLTSGSGVDRVAGQKGNDRLSGGYENDVLRGGPGNDRLAGVWRHDRLNGGPGSDRCKGGPGRDRLTACERGRD